MRYDCQKLINSYMLGRFETLVSNVCPVTFSIGRWMSKCFEQKQRMAEDQLNNSGGPRHE